MGTVVYLFVHNDIYNRPLVDLVVVELCMIGILLSTLKGSNSYKNMEKNIILESSWKYASGLLHISLCTNKLTTVLRIMCEWGDISIHGLLFQ
jgi:hypothetical protein